MTRLDRAAWLHATSLKLSCWLYIIYNRPFLEVIALHLGINWRYCCNYVSMLLRPQMDLRVLALATIPSVILTKMCTHYSTIH